MSNTKFEHYRIRIIEKDSVTVQFHFSDTSMTYNVKVIKSCVNGSSSTELLGLKDLGETVSKGKNTFGFLSK